MHLATHVFRDISRRISYTPLPKLFFILENPPTHSRDPLTFLTSSGRTVNSCAGGGGLFSRGQTYFKKIQGGQTIFGGNFGLGNIHKPADAPEGGGGLRPGVSRVSFYTENTPTH